MKRILEKINEYTQILLYRHINPDDDAFGSQKGMYVYLKTHFPNKNIVLMGGFDHDLVSRFFAEEPINTIKDVPSLGIVMDTANQGRIDGDITLCEYVIKIDHHIVIDSYGDLNIEEPKASSCSEIITYMFMNTLKDYPIPRESAEALYMGIIGDTNRFLYASTSKKTFEAAMTLIDTGIIIDGLYKKMYLKDEKTMSVRRFILNNYINDGGVAYFILRDEDLKELGISRETGSFYVTELANIRDFKIWMAITENKEFNNVRVSIRSRDYAVNEVANQFKGGGHALASGATLDSFDQLPDLVKALKALL